LTFAGITTGAIAWTATDATLAANIAAALNGLSNIGPAGVAGSVGTGTSGIGTYLVTFQNQNADLTVPTITVAYNNMSGTAPTVAVATTTTGVSGTLRQSNPGTRIVDYTKPAVWMNVGTSSAPAFVRFGPFNMAVIPVTGATSTTGGALSTPWQPAEGGPVILIAAALIITTVSTGAANVTIGWGSSASTSYSNLIAATSVHSETAPYVIDSWTTQIIAATGGESGIAPLWAVMPAADYVTVTGSASTAGLVASLHIMYYKY
jgi:hypothetical protein